MQYGSFKSRIKLLGKQSHARNLQQPWFPNKAHFSQGSTPKNFFAASNKRFQLPFSFGFCTVKHKVQKCTCTRTTPSIQFSFAANVVIYLLLAIHFFPLIFSSNFLILRIEENLGPPIPRLKCGVLSFSQLIAASLTISLIIPYF